MHRLRPCVGGIGHRMAAANEVARAQHNAAIPVSRLSMGIATRCFSSSNVTGQHQHQQPPKLAYEWVVDGKVIPSSKMEDRAVSKDNEVIVFLHGLLGNAKVRDTLRCDMCM